MVLFSKKILYLLDNLTKVRDISMSAYEYNIMYKYNGEKKYIQYLVV